MVSTKWFRRSLWSGLILALTSCDTGFCTTDNGMILMGTRDGKPPMVWTCEKINAAEAEMVDFMPNKLFLRDYRIYEVETYSFIDFWGRPVGGYTTCYNKEIIIGTGSDVAPHEIAHALQDCYAPGPIDPVMKEEGYPVFTPDEDHANWVRSGIAKKVWDVSAQINR